MAIIYFASNQIHFTSPSLNLAPPLLVIELERNWRIYVAETGGSMWQELENLCGRNWRIYVAGIGGSMWQGFLEVKLTTLHFVHMQHRVCFFYKI
jgi:hypothetical protein